MPEKITRLDKFAGISNRTVRQLLQDVLEEIASEEKATQFEPYDKAIVICLDTSENQFRVSWFQAGMRMSECLALCDVAKSSLKREMGH